ncbi:sugar transferase [Mycolicibacterium sp.]|uniref:sugar transferase n=1 Tax=Mycolicibacterium sp. TaxID=2320850 RepID=UPI0025F5E662|nr:sugar transferase [Mycolicibacterium sp.]
MITDLAVVVCSVIVAQWLQLQGLATTLNYASFWYSVASLMVVATWMAFLAIYRTRSPRIVGAGIEEYRRVLSATLAVVGLIAIALMVLRPEIARGYLAIALPAGIFGLLVSRSLIRRLVALQRRRGRCLTAVLAVGEVRAVRSLVQSMSREWTYGYSVVGVCLTGSKTGGTIDVPGAGVLPILGSEDDVERAILATKADTVALTATGHLGPDGMRELSWRLDALGVDLVVSPGVVDVGGPRLTLRPVAGLPLIHVEKPQYSGSQRFKKRALDFVLATTALILAAPVMIASAIAIKLTSQGPVFYKSERIGRDGLPFEMIKFRTMVVGSDAKLDELTSANDSVGGVLFKMRADPRVTSIGRYLRRYSVDELPQFINVLRGDMSVVGPRPPLRREVDTYDDQVRRRLLVLPGITGLWQVSGRSDLSWEDSVRLDLSYVENWSITNDLVIAAKTVRTILTASGAY